MDVPYLLQTPGTDELWIVDGERRFLITPKVYDLIVSNGGELPPPYSIEKLREQNAKLRDSLKALMMGTNVELCADRDASQCQECSMALDEHSCVMSNAILLLGIDMYGEPLGGE